MKFIWEGEVTRLHPFYLQPMFKPLLNKITAVEGLTVRDLFRQLFTDNEFTDYIIELNTQYQLYTLGINAKGERLDDIAGGYSPYTIEQKEKKGQPTDRVTLKDTGEFYASFRVKWLAAGDGAMQITANTIKDQTDLIKEWGKDILGLDDESLSNLRNFAAIKIKGYIDRKLAA